MPDLTLDLGTDVAAFLLYHPDDLAHRATSPIGWYGIPFAYRKETRAARLVAFGTGGDGGFRLRLTTGGLTEAEAAAERGRLVFPYRARHGRVFVDNSDGLPGPDQMQVPDAHPERWMDLPNGAYRVTVVDIEGTDTRPDYVIVFEAVETLDGIEPPDRLTATPDLWLPPRPPAPPQRPLKPLAPAYPLLVVGDDAIVPGQHGTTATSRELADALFRQREIVVAANADAAVGTRVRVRGASWSPSTGSVLRIEGLSVVRILHIRPGTPLPSADVAAVERPDEAPTAAAADALLDALEVTAQRSEPWTHDSTPAWTRERIEARDVAWPEALQIAADLLGLSHEERLHAAQQSDSTCVATLTKRLRDANARP